MSAEVAERMTATGSTTARHRRRRALSAVMLGLTGLAALITVVPLILILFYLVRAGAGALNADFFLNTPAPPGETGGGLANAMIGTFVLVVLAALIGLPVAIGAGIFLAEAGRSRLGDFVRFISDVMNGIPSIVTGIFVWATVVVAMGSFSALAGAVALAVMLIPMVSRTTEEMIRLVPREVRDGSLALGATRWRTTFSVILPAARSGIVTGVLVAVARIAGETAPLLFTAFGSPFWSLRLDQPIAALPLQIFQYAISPYDDWHRQAWAAAIVLIGLVLATSLLARFLIRSPYRGRS